MEAVLWGIMHLLALIVWAFIVRDMWKGHKVKQEKRELECL